MNHLRKVSLIAIVPKLMLILNAL